MSLVLINQEFMAREPGKNVPMVLFAGRRKNGRAAVVRGPRFHVGQTINR
jgi:hypothetical protein